MAATTTNSKFAQCGDNRLSLALFSAAINLFLRSLISFCIFKKTFVCKDAWCFVSRTGQIRKTLPATKADIPADEKMKRIIFIIFFALNLWTTILGQTVHEGTVISRAEYNKLAARNLRQTYSSDTQTILNRLDSLLYLDTLNNGRPDLEFRNVGEANKISNKFLLYAQLTKIATENELLQILNDTKELVAVRGYAYMAYAYKCDQDIKKEKVLTYSFKLWVQNGCLVSLDNFNDFKKEIRVRNKYDPYPKKTVISGEEKKAIKVENKIRKEQGENERKE